MAGKSPRWETELWSLLSACDGAHCPVYSHCQVRQRGGWCVEDNKESISRLLYRKRIRPSSHDFLEYAAPCRIFQLVERLAKKFAKWQMSRGLAIFLMVSSSNPFRAIEKDVLLVVRCYS